MIVLQDLGFHMYSKRQKEEGQSTGSDVLLCLSVTIAPSTKGPLLIKQKGSQFKKSIRKAN